MNWLILYRKCHETSVDSEDNGDYTNDDATVKSIIVLLKIVGKLLEDLKVQWQVDCHLYNWREAHNELGIISQTIMPRTIKLLNIFLWDIYNSCWCSQFCFQIIWTRNMPAKYLVNELRIRPFLFLLGDLYKAGNYIEINLDDGRIIFSFHIKTSISIFHIKTKK